MYLFAVLCVYLCSLHSIVRTLFHLLLFSNFCLHHYFLFDRLVYIIIAGWFAKDPIILRRVGHLLLQVPFAVQRNPRSIIIADDCFQLVKNSVDRVAPVVIKSTEKLFGSMFF